MCGPVAVRGAKPGMALEILIKILRPALWGESAGGGFPNPVNDRLGLSGGAICECRWIIDPVGGTAVNQFGDEVTTSPFMGVMGMPPDEPGVHSSYEPRFSGGNLDCKELVAGSRLYLPIPLEGALFSLGDGHAVQGDGEVAGMALECPMDLVEVEFRLRQGINAPRAWTPSGWITFGLHADLNEAGFCALEEMLKLMAELYDFNTQRALALASLVVDLRVTQIVNGVCGVHAILPHGALGKVDAGND